MKKVQFFLFFILLIYGINIFGQNRSTAYKTINDSVSLKLSFFQRKVKNINNKTCVILLPGGDWEDFYNGQLNELAFGLSDLGILPVAVEYRTKKKHNSTPYDALADVKDAIKYLRNNANYLNIDKEKIVIVGISAGGHLSFSSYLVNKIGDKSYDEDSRPNFIIGISPVIRNDSLGHANKRIGDNYKWFSPFYSYINTDTKLPPSLIISGENDHLIKDKDLIEFYKKAIEKNDKMNLFIVDNVGHSMKNKYKSLYIQSFPIIHSFLNNNNLINNENIIKEYKLKNNNLMNPVLLLCLFFVVILITYFFRKSRKLLIIIVGISLYSCNDLKENIDKTESTNNSTEIYFEDSYENGIAAFWDKEVKNEERYAIVNDPLDETNKVLKLNVKLEDTVNRGKRAEFAVKLKDSFGYQNNYSFKFMLPADFFKKEETQGSYIIHQWHDEPQAGFSWKTNKNKTRPPFWLAIQHDNQGNYKLKFCIGLQSGSMNETRVVIWDKELKSEKWYTFSNEIFWSLYAKDGYVIPKIDDELFIESGKKVEKIYRRNMYNIYPNYFKYGLYRHGKQKHNRSIYFDDFEMTSRRVAY